MPKIESRDADWVKRLSLFEVHMLNDQGIEKAKKLQSLFDDFLNELIAMNTAEGREMAIVFTKLQEASFFAKRAMAMRSENNQ